MSPMSPMSPTQALNALLILKFFFVESESKSGFREFIFLVSSACVWPGNCLTAGNLVAGPHFGAITGFSNVDQLMKNNNEHSVRQRQTFGHGALGLYKYHW